MPPLKPKSDDNRPVRPPKSDEEAARAAYMEYVRARGGALALLREEREGRAWERARVRAARAGLAKGLPAKREQRERDREKSIPEVVRRTIAGEPAKIIADRLRVSMRTVAPPVPADPRRAPHALPRYAHLRPGLFAPEDRARLVVDLTQGPGEVVSLPGGPPKVHRPATQRGAQA